MKKKFWIGLAMIFVITGMLFAVSCAKKTVDTDADVEAQRLMQEEEARLAAERAEQEEMARQLEEARLRALKEERLKEEAARAEQEAARAAQEAAMKQFINEHVYFEFDSSALLSAAQNVLKQKAEWLRENPNVSIFIEGHCDERGTNEYNLALGDRRASSVKAFLMDLGVSGSQLTTISYGEERPLDPRSNEEAWAKNRRVQFVIVE